MRNVIVTGGSRGLGLSITSQLASTGYHVISIARHETEELAKALADVRLGRISFTSYDLSDIEGMPGLVRELRRSHGPIYGLINNAGLGTSGLLATINLGDIEQLVRINVLSPLALTRQVIRSMMAEGEGRIVNISSIVATTGYSSLSVYSATKAAMMGFTRSLARELGRAGITVNAVAPGFIDTAMTDGLPSGERERIVRRSALQRLAEAGDIARAVEFLLGEGGRNITGTQMTIDAGNTA